MLSHLSIENALKVAYHAPAHVGDNVLMMDAGKQRDEKSPKQSRSSHYHARSRSEWDGNVQNASASKADAEKNYNVNKYDNRYHALLLII